MEIFVFIIKKRDTFLFLSFPSNVLRSSLILRKKRTVSITFFFLIGKNNNNNVEF